MRVSRWSLARRIAGESAAGMERDAERLRGGPFPGQLEDEGAVALPTPDSGQSGFQPDQLGTQFFIDQAKRRRTVIEMDIETGWIERVRQRGNLQGRDHAVDEVRRNGQPSMQVSVASREASEHGDEQAHGFRTVRPSHGRHDAQPAGRLPGDVAQGGSDRPSQERPAARGESGKMIPHASEYVDGGSNLTNQTVDAQNSSSRQQPSASDSCWLATLEWICRGLGHFRVP